jgi:hypothetical protein
VTRVKSTYNRLIDPYNLWFGLNQLQPFFMHISKGSCYINLQLLIKSRSCKETFKCIVNMFRYEDKGIKVIYIRQVLARLLLSSSDVGVWAKANADLSQSDMTLWHRVIINSAWYSSAMCTSIRTLSSAKRTKKLIYVSKWYDMIW